MSECGQPARGPLVTVVIMTKNLAEQTLAFAALHKPGDPLLLPNAWDAASAVVIAAAGALAIATTSAGVAWSLGVPDGACPGSGLDAGRVAEVVARIVAVAGVPVSVDIEDGYTDVARTVAAVVAAGAVGVNLEDRAGPGVLRDVAGQAERIAVARSATPGQPIWINARTDVFLGGSGELAEVRDRAAAYAEAGADSLFVPGLTDLAAIASLAQGPLPVAVMVWPGAPTVAELAAAGVARISLGSAIAQAAYAVAARAATEMLTAGTYDSCAGGIAYDTMNSAVRTGIQ
jgi:2-methylisocitrate lyase-like PEP mutase family enzyme